MPPTAKSSHAATLLVLLPAAALFALLTSALTMRTQGGAAARPGCDQDLGRHMSETSRRVGEAELLPALRAALAFRHADPACAGSAVDGSADNRTLEVVTLRGGSHT